MLIVKVGEELNLAKKPMLAYKPAELWFCMWLMSAEVCVVLLGRCAVQDLNPRLLLWSSRNPSKIFCVCPSLSSITQCNEFRALFCISATVSSIAPLFYLFFLLSPQQSACTQASWWDGRFFRSLNTCKRTEGKSIYFWWESIRNKLPLHFSLWDKVMGQFSIPPLHVWELTWMKVICKGWLENRQFGWIVLDQRLRSKTGISSSPG